MDEFKLGTYIKKRREELRISQEELCEGLCAVSSLSRIENNQQDPSRLLTRNLLERLGLPQDKFTAFWGQRDITVGALMREITNDMIRRRRMPKESRIQMQEQIQEKLTELEMMTDPSDRSIRQFLLAKRACLGGPKGPYAIEETLAMQLEAIRLTCPKFDPEDFQHGRYSMDECNLINQIANSYLDMGQRKRAIDIYRQLLWYVEKNCKELVDYSDHFCLIAQNYAITLGLEKRYLEAIEISERGRKICIYSGQYQFLPSFLAIQAESYYFIGEEERSKKLYFQTYYIYDAFEDKSNWEHMRQEMKEHLGIEMPE